VRRPDRAGLLLAAAAAIYVGAAWLSRPGFYDGFAPPADSYRWVQAPAGVTSNGEKPLPGNATLAVSSDHSRVAGGTLATGEKPAQAAVVIPPGALMAPNQDSVTVDLVPQAAPGRPANAFIVGNLYCLTSTVAFTRGQQLQLTLRYSDQLPGANAVYRYDDENRAWVELPASHNGSAATVTAVVSALGCYAPATHLPASPTPGPAAVVGNRWLPYLTAGVIVLVLLSGLPLYLRTRRERRRKDRA
jgi:hypothetical protein